MKNQKALNRIRIAIMLLLVLVVIPLLPILISGRWSWWQAWVMTAIFILSFIISRILAARKNPGILAERANYNQHQLVVGLDAAFHWSAGFSLPVQLTGLVLIVAGYLLASYAFVENAYFSGTVRIQGDRGHKVVSTGPYGWVRHPGYLGSVIASLGMPLLLDSVCAFIPVVVFGIFFIIRTRLEDRFLQANLPGYHQYAQKVRYRLLPGIW